MDLEVSPEQLSYQETVLGFARDELNEDVQARDVEETFSGDLWKACAAFGIQGLPIPDAYGGSEADALTVAIALEGLGRGCRDNGLLFSIGAQMWSFQIPLLMFGTEDQKRRYLPGLCDGSLIGAQAMTEPDSGSDAFNLSCRAVEDGDSYVLNGSKAFITNAPVADLLIIFATTAPEQGFAGLTAFVVERETPGIAVSPSRSKMGLRTSPLGDVFLQDCRIAKENALGPIGAGMAIFNTAMEWERGLILAPALGTMQRQLEDCVSYARQRLQFGRPIGDYQAISHKIADMAVRLEAGRLLVYRFAHLKAKGRSASLEASMAKLHISESFVQSSLDAVQIHGGYGYMSELGVERDLRDAVASRIYSGTSEIQRNLIARQTGL